MRLTAYPLLMLYLLFGAATAQEKPAVSEPAKTEPAKEAAPKPEVKPETKPEAKPAETLAPPAPLTEQEEAARKAAELQASKERELAAERAREAEARRIEESKTFFDKLLENSQFYTGVHGGMVVGLNSLHKPGYGFGMTLDYLAYERYGLHFAAETGIMPTRAVQLPAGTTTVSVTEGGSYGFLNLNLAAVYAPPSLFGIFPAVGAGVALYQLRGGTYDFSQVAAPFVYGSLYYHLSSNLQVGFLTNLVLPASDKVTSANSEYKLDTAAGQSALGLNVSVRYAWF